MKNETRVLFNRYLDRQGELNGVDAEDIRRGSNFTVLPSVQQILESKVKESSDFLTRINIVPVDEMEGAKLGLGTSGPIASRTNTTAADRTTSDPSTLDERGYKCVQTNSDTHLTYAKLDLWAKFPDFQPRIRDSIVKQQALDRIMVGFNGRSVAATTDKGANPLLQDLNKGWLQYLREVAPTHVMSEGAEDDEIRIGAGGDYATFDSLVVDAKNTLLPSWAQADTGLIAFCGGDLLHDKYFPMIDTEFNPTEQVARDIILSKKQLGGLPAARVPFFPDGSILVTTYENFSIYYQDGKRRRTVVDNAKRDRIENFESSNDAYVLENTDYAFLLENVVTQWAP